MIWERDIRDMEAAISSNSRMKDEHKQMVEKVKEIIKILNERTEEVWALQEENEKLKERIEKIEKLLLNKNLDIER